MFLLKKRETFIFTSTAAGSILWNFLMSAILTSTTRMRFWSNSFHSGFVNKEQEKSILLLSGFIAAVVLDKAHNLVRKGFPAGFAEMDMNVKGRAADVLHKVGFGGQRGSGCGGAGLAGFIVHRLSFQR